MGGEQHGPHGLVSTAVQSASDFDKAPLKWGLSFLLGNQYVSVSSGSSGQKSNSDVKHVKIGSGMGMTCSDETSSVNFYSLVEAPFICRTRSENCIKL